MINPETFFYTFFSELLFINLQPNVLVLKN